MGNDHAASVDTRRSFLRSVATGATSRPPPAPCGSTPAGHHKGGAVVSYGAPTGGWRSRPRRAAPAALWLTGGVGGSDLTSDWGGRRARSPRSPRLF